MDLKISMLTFLSPAVGKTVRAIALLPPKAEHAPVLYLLHGRNSSPEFWTGRTRLRSLLPGTNLAVVCLTGENGFYTNSLKGGADWEDSILRDQIPRAESWFKIGGERSRRMIAGFSLGGFGAMKLALKRFDTFCGVHTISGSFGSAQSTDEPLKMEIFGPPHSGQRQQNDPFHLAGLVPHTQRPAVQFDCGLSDELLEANRRFDALLDSLKWPHAYHETPGGHTSAYVDTRLPELLAFAQQQLRSIVP
jgi:putative tributyrin esterase